MEFYFKKSAATNFSVKYTKAASSQFRNENAVKKTMRPIYAKYDWWLFKFNVSQIRKYLYN